MKKVLIVRGKGIVVEEVPSPQISQKDVLVASAYSLLSSGTEKMVLESGKEGILKKALHRPDLVKKAIDKIKQGRIKELIERVQGIMKEPVPVGYSLSGIVIEKGTSLRNINVGDRVACAGAEFANHAEIVSVPRNLVVKIPDGVSFEEASFTTLGAIAMQGIRRAERSFGETIVVMGLGLLGNLGAQIALASGYKVIGFDINEERVKLSKSLGIDSYNLKSTDPVKLIFEKTENRGADAVVLYVATNSSEPVNLAFDMLRQRGRAVLVGVCGLLLDRGKMYRKELDFVISTSYGPGRYDPVYEKLSIDYPIGYVRWTENRNMSEFLDLLKRKKIKVKPLISKVFSVDDASQAYSEMEKGKSLAILLKYTSEKYKKGISYSDKRVFISPPKEIKGKVKIGLVGPGNFALNVHLPNLKKLEDFFHLRGVVSLHPEKAKFIAKRWGFDYATGDYQEILDDPEIDLVFITTRHNLHYPFVMDALNKGKSVFVEKPLCLKQHELNEIKKKVAEKKIPVIVGFNRRYSPFIKGIKKALDLIKKPSVVVYRVNAGFIPSGSWIQDPEIGGGRIIGECCHFFDVFNFIEGSEVESIKVDYVPVDNKSIAAPDNILVSVKYKNGSVCILIYTSIGNNNLPKERIEVFVDGKSFVIDDYRVFEIYGFPPEKIGFSKNKKVLKTQDKGLYYEMFELAKFLHKEKSEIIDFNETVKAMEITFLVADMIHKGDGYGKE